MTLSRYQDRWLLGAIVALLIAGALGLGLGRRFVQPQIPQLAADQLQSAAARHQVSTTDQIIWDKQERLRQVPEDIDAYAVLGNAYLQKVRETGDPSFYGKAESVFAAALARDNSHVEALIGSGTLALSRHQFREALAIGKQVQAINPSVARIYGLIGDAQVELGMYDEAVQTFQTMVDLRPDLSSYSRASYMRELHGDLDGAIEAMDAAVTAGGPAAENTQWARVQLGNLYFNRGDLDDASYQYRFALARLPGYVYAQAGLARVQAAQGKTAEATALLQQTIDRMPLPEFVIALGEIEEASGNTAAATKQYALVRAMQQLFAANGVDTDLELALFDADHGSDPQATVALARTVYARRPSIKAADTLAWALFKAGQPAEAQRYITEALRLGTQDALMLYHAGMIAKALNDQPTAHDYLSRALALNPHFSPLYAPAAQRALGGNEQ